MSTELSSSVTPYGLGLLRGTFLSVNPPLEIRCLGTRGDMAPNQWLGPSDKIPGKSLFLTSSAGAQINFDSNQQPRNWALRRKVWVISILVFLEFFVTIIATTGSAAVHYARSDFPNNNKKALMASFVSTYSIGQAIGSLAIPQFTESYGRRWFYIWSSAAFSLTCVLTGVTKSIVGVIFGRLLSGLASAVPAVVVAGSVEDLFNEKQRIWLIWVWNCSTVAGQVLGPVYSSYIAAALGW